MRYINVLVVFLIGVGVILFINQSTKDKKIPLQIPKVQNQTPSDNDTNTALFQIVAQNLDTPWGIAFLPDNSLLVTERKGQVKRVEKNGNIDLINTIQSVKEIGEGGLLGITLHPKFSENSFIYLYYTYSSIRDDTLNRVVRMTYENNELSDEKIIVDEIPGASNHNGGRIKFGPDGNLYITTGDAQNPSQAQKTNTLGGKILSLDAARLPGRVYCICLQIPLSVILYLW